MDSPSLEPVRGRSIAALAKAVGVSRTTIYEEIRAGRLRVTKIGKRSIILDPDERDWIATLRGGDR